MTDVTAASPAEGGGSSDVPDDSVLSPQNLENYSAVSELIRISGNDPNVVDRCCLAGSFVQFFRSVLHDEDKTDKFADFSRWLPITKLSAHGNLCLHCMVESAPDLFAPMDGRKPYLVYANPCDLHAPPPNTCCSWFPKAVESCARTALDVAGDTNYAGGHARSRVSVIHFDPEALNMISMVLQRHRASPDKAIIPDVLVNFGCVVEAYQAYGMNVSQWLDMGIYLCGLHIFNPRWVVSLQSGAVRYFVGKTLDIGYKPGDVASYNGYVGRQRKLHVGMMRYHAGCEPSPESEGSTRSDTNAGTAGSGTGLHPESNNPFTFSFWPDGAGSPAEEREHAPPESGPAVGEENSPEAAAAVIDTSGNGSAPPPTSGVTIFFGPRIISVVPELAPCVIPPPHDLAVPTGLPMPYGPCGSGDTPLPTIDAPPGLSHPAVASARVKTAQASGTDRQVIQAALDDSGFNPEWRDDPVISRADDCYHTHLCPCPCKQRFCHAHGKPHLHSHTHSFLRESSATHPDPLCLRMVKGFHMLGKCLTCPSCIVEAAPPAPAPQLCAGFTDKHRTPIGHGYTTEGEALGDLRAGYDLQWTTEPILTEMASKDATREAERERARKLMELPGCDARAPPEEPMIPKSLTKKQTHIAKTARDTRKMDSQLVKGESDGQFMYLWDLKSGLNTNVAADNVHNMKFGAANRHFKQTGELPPGLMAHVAGLASRVGTQLNGMLQASRCADELSNVMGWIEEIDTEAGGPVDVSQRMKELREGTRPISPAELRWGSDSEEGVHALLSGATAMLVMDPKSMKSRSWDTNRWVNAAWMATLRSMGKHQHDIKFAKEGFKRTISIKLNESLQKRKPRLIISAGDVACYTHLYDAAVFEEAFFSHPMFKSRSIKKTDLEGLKRRMEKVFTKFSSGKGLCADFAAWDSSLSSGIREVIENKVLKYVLSGFMGDSPIARSAELDRNKSTFTGTYTAPNRDRVKVTSTDMIRESGDRGTTILNYLTNLIMFMVIISMEFMYSEGLLQCDEEGNLLFDLNYKRFTSHQKTVYRNITKQMEKWLTEPEMRAWLDLIAEGDDGLMLFSAMFLETFNKDGKLPQRLVGHYKSLGFTLEPGVAGTLSAEELRAGRGFQDISERIEFVSKVWAVTHWESGPDGRKFPHVRVMPKPCKTMTNSTVSFSKALTRNQAGFMKMLSFMDNNVDVPYAFEYYYMCLRYYRRKCDEEGSVHVNTGHMVKGSYDFVLYTEKLVEDRIIAKYEKAMCAPNIWRMRIFYRYETGITEQSQKYEEAQFRSRDGDIEDVVIDVLRRHKVFDYIKALEHHLGTQMPTARDVIPRNTQGATSATTWRGWGGKPTPSRCDPAVGPDGCAPAVGSPDHGWEVPRSRHRGPKGKGKGKCGDGETPQGVMPAAPQVRTGRGQVKRIVRSDKCFPPGTLIKTTEPDTPWSGRFRDIAYVSAGDHIVCTDPETGRERSCRVRTRVENAQAPQKIYTLNLANGASMRATGQHGIYVQVADAGSRREFPIVTQTPTLERHARTRKCRQGFVYAQVQIEVEEVGENGRYRGRLIYALTESPGHAPSWSAVVSCVPEGEEPVTYQLLVEDPAERLIGAMISFHCPMTMAYKDGMAVASCVGRVSNSPWATICDVQRNGPVASPQPVQEQRLPVPVPRAPVALPLPPHTAPVSMENFKGLLQTVVQHELGRPVAQGDIVYRTTILGGASFVTQVKVVHWESRPSCPIARHSGEVQRRVVEAEQSAAKQAISVWKTLPYAGPLALGDVEEEVCYNAAEQTTLFPPPGPPAYGMATHGHNAADPDRSESVVGEVDAGASTTPSVPTPFQSTVLQCLINEGIGRSTGGLRNAMQRKGCGDYSRDAVETACWELEAVGLMANQAKGPSGGGRCRWVPIRHF
jgi:hypothetical protein